MAWVVRAEEGSSSMDERSGSPGKALGDVGGCFPADDETEV